MKLQACVVKGCTWRGPNRHDCPMHREDDEQAWERQTRLRLNQRPRGLMLERRP